MRRAVQLACLVAAVVLGTAAGPGKSRRAYERQYYDFTRELTLYDGFSTSLILRGTLLEPHFRHVMAAERQRRMDPSAADHAAFLARMEDDGATWHEVVLSADSGVPGPMRFGEGDDSWKLRLSADGADQELVTAYRVREPTPVHRVLYLHLNRWSQLWVARFHRTVANPDTVVMHVGSGWGHGTLEWTDLRSHTAP